MHVFKQINRNDFTLSETKIHKQQSLNSASLGIVSVQYRSGSKLNDYQYDTSGSQWSSLHSMFYASGSTDEDQLNQPAASLGHHRLIDRQFLSKFYPTGSVLSIPQQYYGERIKPSSLKITDTHNPKKEIIIIDDGNGNLYSTNATLSQSLGPLSSSDNYLGNIFYESGLIILAETGSSHQEDFEVKNDLGIELPVIETVSGEDGVNVLIDTATVNEDGTPIDLAPFVFLKDAMIDKYKVEFESTQTVFTQEYTVRIDPSEYNSTMNHTVRGFLSGSSENLHTNTPFIGPDFTGSGWTPYLTQIHLYSDKPTVMGSFDNNPNGDIPLQEPVIIANLPRAIKMRPDMAMTFKLRLDV